MKVTATPVVEADANLQDPVIETADGRGRVAPEQLERFVLLEELVGVELGDATQKCFWWGLCAAGAGWLVWCTGRLPLRRAS